MIKVQIADGVAVGEGCPLVLIAGPCVIESEKVMNEAAERLSTLARAHGVSLIFKSSYEKDNRTVPEAFRGPGLDAGLELLQRLRQRFGFPVLTDVHRTVDVQPAAEVVDVLQVPALLSRQTSLLEAVGRAGKTVNLKKGPFLAPQSMAGAVAKVHGMGNDRVLITERGTTFGYERLVCDLAALPTLRALGCPIVLDAGHASNRPAEISVLARAGAAVGADALFIECHPDPSNALSDDKRMLSIDQLERLLPTLVQISRLVRENAS